MREALGPQSSQEVLVVENMLVVGLVESDYILGVLRRMPKVCGLGKYRDGILLLFVEMVKTGG